MLIDDENVKMSYISGFEFVFLDNENQIEVLYSGMTGREQVLLNGRVVSQSRNYRFMSSHLFSDADADYEIELGLESISSASFACSFRKDSKLIRTYKLKHITKESRMSPAWSYLLSVVVALAISLLDLGFWISLAIAVLAIISISVYLTRGRWEYSIDV